MRQIFLNVNTLTKDKGDALEQEMSFVFETPEKHTWREGYVCHLNSARTIHSTLDLNTAVVAICLIFLFL